MKITDQHTPDRVATILTLSARGQQIRELLYEALVFAEIPPERAAKGALVLAQVLEGDTFDAACARNRGRPAC